MTQTIETIAAFEGRMAKVEGAARTGKTEALIAHVAQAVRCGMAPESIALVCTSALACQAARKRLRARMGDEYAEAAGRVRIATAQQLCLEMLQTPEAYQFTGREARVLSPDEYNFFLEDMKTLGQPVRRLRNMLGFFYKQWANLEPESAWLEPGEETNARARIAQLLKTEHAMLFQEVAPLCYEYLHSNAGAGARKAFAALACDDFQNLTRAQQNCMCMLAGEQLLVAGNASQASRDVYAHPEGFATFEENRTGVEVFTLTETFHNPAATAFTSAVLGEANATSAANASDGLEVLKWNTPEDELAGVATLVANDVYGGVVEHDICIVAPNKMWAKTLVDELAKRNVKAAMPTFTRKLGGDPRDANRCAALIAYVKLALIANPEDAVAWRCWCGIGNYLTNSDAWTGLLESALANNYDALDALRAANKACQAGEEPFLRAGALAKRYEEGLSAIAHATGRKGFALLRSIGADGLPAFEPCRQLIEGDEGPADLLALVQRTLENPEFDEDPHKVRILDYESTCGLQFQRVYMPGAIDGFVPTREVFDVVSTQEKRDAARASWRRQFCNAAAKANEQLTITYFSKAELELAERTKMHVTRVRADDGRRMALVRPSCFLSEAGAACPGANGGQAKLASLGLA